MTYAKRAVLLAVASALVLCVLGSPAKLDQVAATAAQHSRGGFRAGPHDTGIWGANLDKLRNITPPRWGSNSLVNRPRKPSFSAGANSFNKQFGSANKLQDSHQVGGSSNINRLVSPNSPSGGYSIPSPAPIQQGYNYSPPKKPFNLYQPPPPPSTTTTTTTTTTRRPPPAPPSGLYQTPIKFRPIPVRPQTPRPTTTRRPLVHAPSNLYQTPQVFRPLPQRPQTPRPTTTTTSTRRPSVQAPTNLYQTPQLPTNLYQTPQLPTNIYQTPEVPNSLYQIPQASRPVPQRRPPQSEPPQPPMPAMPYEFAYGVNDSPSGNHYTREESHDGNVMRGQYKVLLPDGRTQIVTYFDDGNGFNAEVTYE